MASFVSSARPDRIELEDQGSWKSKFSRSSWARIEHREVNKAPVTVWVGISNVIVAIELPDYERLDLRVSVFDMSLLFRGKGRDNLFSHDVELPCAVETHPIHVMKERDHIYVLLVKKQERTMVTVEGSLCDRNPYTPELTSMHGS